MKKNKREITLVILIIFFAIGCVYFYKESKSITTINEIKYEEKGNIDYKVYLTDKKYYNRDYLNSGMQDISSIIDYIELNYRYSVDYEKSDNYDINKKVSADVKIVDRDNNDKIIYTKNETIKEEKISSDKIDLNDTIKIDYKKYNNLANEFKTSYGITASCDLVINYSIEYNNESNEIRQNKLMTVVIPLSQQMINITKSNDIYNNSSYVGSTTESTINKVMFVLSIVLLIITIIAIFVLISEISSRKKKESKYDNHIRKILKEYDSYITEAKQDAYDLNKSIIKIGSFKELLDVRNTLEKAIVYVKVDENTSKFMIIDNEIYEYKVTREELDK